MAACLKRLGPGGMSLNPVLVKFSCREVVVDQLGEWLLLTTDVCCSNPVNNKNLLAFDKTKIKKERPWMDQ